VRIFLRKLGEAAAPVLFGWMSVSVFAGNGAHGLQTSLVVMLGVLVLAVLVLPLALGSYARDVATAAPSVHATMPAA